MKILIWNDIEGVSGIDDPETGFNDDRHMDLITKEINSVIKGLKKAGAKQIEIFDGHGMGDNLNLEILDKKAKYLGGGWMVVLADLIRSRKFSEYDALILLGMHSQEGTIDGFIAHTNSMLTALYLNNKPIGEIEQAAWLAGYFGVPTILVSGDYAAIKEAKYYLPEIETQATKKKEGEKFICLPLEEIYENLEEKANKKLKEISKIKPYTFEGPIEVKILHAFEKAAEDMSIFPGYEKTDNRTVIYHAKDFLEAFWAYHGFRPILQGLYSQPFYKLIDEMEEQLNLDFQKDIKPLLDKVTNEFFSTKIQFPEINF
jgi:D-amino peptidase